MRLYDLTELTGIKADSERTQVVATFQVPARFFAPGAVGLVVGLLAGLAVIKVVGVVSLVLGPLSMAAAVWLTADEVEPPWKRIVRTLRGREGRFMYCHVPIDLHPAAFIAVVPSVV